MIHVGNIKNNTEQYDNICWEALLDEEKITLMGNLDNPLPVQHFMPFERFSPPSHQGHPEFPVNPKISENLRVAGGEKTSSQNGRSRSTLELVQNSCVCFKGTDTGENII